MKKNYLFKNIGRMSMAIGLFATALLSSCLKDTSPGTINFGTSPAVIGFQYAGFSFQPYVAAIYGNANDTVDLKVTLSVASITLKSAVSATLVADDALVTSSGYNVLPTADYSIPNNGAITWAPGQQYVTVHIKFAGQNIDFTQNYAFALKITAANGAVIASNLDEALVTIVLKSIYAGNYHASGVRIHPVLGTIPFDYKVEMNTVNKTTIDGNALADLTADLQLQVNPDNTVIVTSAAQTTTANTVGAVNKYDPATKTFTLNYQYNLAAPRVMHETMVYDGP